MESKLKIIVFGASGGTGRHVVEQALETGYKVTAFVRRPEKLGVDHPNLTIFQGDPQDQPKLFDQIMKGLLTLMAGSVLRDSEANVSVIRSSNLNWTIVRYPCLIDGEHTGNYRAGYVGKDSGSQLSRADRADFVLKELESGEYVHKMPIVSY